jgi:hypothetical protein
MEDKYTSDAMKMEFINKLDVRKIGDNYYRKVIEVIEVFQRHLNDKNRKALKKIGYKKFINIRKEK